MSFLWQYHFNTGVVWIFLFLYIHKKNAETEFMSLMGRESI